MAPSISLPSLPAEVWTLAWNLVRSQEDLKSLSLTCCLFRSICQNILFTEIQFSSKPITDLPAFLNLAPAYPGWKERIKQGVQRMESLSRHPAHKYSVTTLKLEGTSEYTIGDFQQAFPQERVFETYQTLVSSFLLALESFTNLRHVHLGPSITVTDEFVHALSQLPNLDELVMRGPCSTSIASPMIEVKVLTLSAYQDSVSGLGLCSAQRMTSLTLHDTMPPETLLRHELARKEVNFLTHMVLYVRTIHLDAVFSFLPSCRNLESLGLYPYLASPSDERRDVLDLRVLSLPNDLPRLSSFIGPIKLAELILPGRPIIDTEIIGLYSSGLPDYRLDVEALEDTFLRPLLQTSVPLRRFCSPLIPLSGKMLEVICRYFPRLQSLELGFSAAATGHFEITEEDTRLMAFLQENGCDPSTDSNSGLDENETRCPDSLKVIIKDICDGRVPLPKGLASLQISVFWIAQGHQVWPVAEERAIVLALSEVYPALEFVAFGIDGAWRAIRPWVRNNHNGGRWKPLVPPKEDDFSSCIFLI